MSGGTKIQSQLLQSPRQEDYKFKCIWARVSSRPAWAKLMRPCFEKEKERREHQESKGEEGRKLKVGRLYCPVVYWVRFSQ